MEGQGVTSWSSDDLRVKYRAEREREEAYQAFRLEEQVAEALDQEYGQASRRIGRCGTHDRVRALYHMSSVIMQLHIYIPLRWTGSDTVVPVVLRRPYVQTSQSRGIFPGHAPRKP